MIARVVGEIWVRLNDPLGPSDIDPDDARDRACDVTSTGRICNPAAPERPEPPSNAPDLPDAGAGAGFFGQLLVLLLVLGLVVGAVWLVMRWVDGSDRSDDDNDGEPIDVDESLDEAVDARIVDHETPPDRWRRLAGEARSSGDLREAIRCQYRALVGDLARAGYVDEIPGRTSGEEREQVGEIAPRLGDVGVEVARQFDVAADTFDAAWFDDADVTSAEDQRFLGAERAVLDVVLSGTSRRLARREVRDGVAS